MVVRAALNACSMRSGRFVRRPDLRMHAVIGKLALAFQVIGAIDLEDAVAGHCRIGVARPPGVVGACLAGIGRRLHTDWTSKRLLR